MTSKDEKQAVEEFNKIAYRAPIAANSFLTLADDINKVGAVLNLMSPSDLAGYIFDSMNHQNPTEVESGAMKGWLLLAILEFIKTVNADKDDTEVSTLAIAAAERITVDAMKTHRLDDRVKPGWWKDLAKAVAALPEPPE